MAKILIVEDESEVLHVLSNMLRQDKKIAEAMESGACGYLIKIDLKNNDLVKNVNYFNR